MHILLLSSWPYKQTDNSLSGIFVQHQARALHAAGLKIGIISAGLIPWTKLLSKYPYKNFEIESGIPVYRHFKRTLIPGRILIRLGLGQLLPEYEKLYLQYVSENGIPHIIHAHNCLFAGTIAKHIKLKYNIPYIITEHSSEYGRKMLTYRQLSISRQAFLQANSIIAVSHAQKKHITDAMGKNIKTPYINIIPNLVDPSIENHASYKTIKINPSNNFTFISIGSLDTNKNHANLLLAFATAFRNNSNINLRIIGDGPEKNNLHKLIKILDISSQVHMLGQLERLDTLNEITHCNSLVHSSNFETFGVVLIEALMFGKPVISTDCGGPSDIINSENGIITPVKDHYKLSLAMTKLYTEYESYNSINIQRECQISFGSESVAKKLISLYHHTINSL